MKAIIYYSLNDQTREIIQSFDGDVYEIKPDVRVPKRRFWQMFTLGYYSTRKTSRPIKQLNIDFDQYQEIVLATPVWAGKISCFMRAFLEQTKIENKNITLVASCLGGPGQVMGDYKQYVSNNEIQEEILYIKGERQ
jgi:hypothetical protein